MFSFVKDHKQQSGISGQFRALGDQTKYRSIYGVVDGPQAGPWTGQQIESGEVFSADGKARMGGVAFQDAKGKHHDVKSGQTTYREYLVPIKSVEAWNQYEALQGNQLQDRFLADQRSKPERAGLADIQENLETVEEEAIQHQTVASPAPRKSRPVKNGWTPERKAAQSATMKARHASKLAA